MIVPRGFLLRWVLASAAGALVGAGGPKLLIAVFLFLLGDRDDEHAWLWYELGTFGMVHLQVAIAGACFGYAQWRVLQTSLPGLSKPGSIASTTVGAVISVVPAVLAAIAADSAAGEGIVGAFIALGVVRAITGAIGGGIQAAVLREYVANPWHWVWTSVAGWSTAPVFAVGWALALRAVREGFTFGLDDSMVFVFLGRALEVLLPFVGVTDWWDLIRQMPDALFDTIGLTCATLPASALTGLMVGRLRPHGQRPGWNW